jgi:hypothetical protein
LDGAGGQLGKERRERGFQTDGQTKKEREEREREIERDTPTHPHTHTHTER